MTNPSRERDVEQLLAGRAAASEPELTALVTALRGLSSPVTPSPALAALLRDGLDPAAVSPAVDVPTLAGPVPLPSRRRRALTALAGTSLALKVLATTGVAVAGVGTAVGTGVLPQAVDERVAAVVRALTPFGDAEVPSPTRVDSERRDEPAPQRDPGETAEERPAAPVAPAEPLPVDVPADAADPQPRPATQAPAEPGPPPVPAPAARGPEDPAEQPPARPQQQPVEKAPQQEQPEQDPPAGAEIPQDPATAGAPDGSPSAAQQVPVSP